MKYEYKPDPELRRIYNRQPHVAEARKRMADSYRRIRKDNPAMARLIARGVTRAADQFVNDFWNQPSGHGGLAGLLK